MKTIKASIAALTLVFTSCTKNQECTMVGRWVSVSYNNTMYEYTDSLRYTIYSTNGSFGTIADAIPGPNDWYLDGDSIDVDLNFGHHLRAYPSFDCNCEVVDLITPQATITLSKEGFDINDCR